MELLNQRIELIRYLNMKVSIEDWHGVMDAAADLREIDAEIKGREREKEAVAALKAYWALAEDVVMTKAVVVEDLP